MKTQKMKTQKIEKLQQHGVMTFALPEYGRGYVTESGELLLRFDDTIRSFGHFEKSLSDEKYFFVYQPETRMSPVARLIPEELHSIDEGLAKDLYAFAVKLGYFLAKHPYYESTRDHDWDVFAHKQYRKLHTPLAKAGFRVEAHSTC